MNNINSQFEEKFIPKDGIVKITSDVTDSFYASTWAWAENKDKFSSKFFETCVGSENNSDFVDVYNFDPDSHRWAKWFTFKNGVRFKQQDIIHTLAPDGIGTKTILHDALSQHGNGANDMTAMVADDIARYGWVCAALTSVLELPTLKKDKKEIQEYHQLIERIAQIAKEQKFVILNGETAETGACVGTTIPFEAKPFNRSGVMYGLFHKDLMISNKNVKPGNVLVALKQDGFRSNGISAVRKWFEIKYGKNWYKDAPREEIMEAAAPSVVYANAIAHANGWYNNWQRQADITGIAHLSGWSFKGKLLEGMLGKNNLSAHFNNLFPIPEIEKKVALRTQEDPDRGMKDVAELLATRCGGQWAIAALSNNEEAEKFIAIMKQHGIEAQIAGTVVETEESQAPSITIENIR